MDWRSIKPIVLLCDSFFVPLTVIFGLFLEYILKLTHLKPSDEPLSGMFRCILQDFPYDLADARLWRDDISPHRLIIDFNLLVIRQLQIRVLAGCHSSISLSHLVRWPRILYIPYHLLLLWILQCGGRWRQSITRGVRMRSEDKILAWGIQIEVSIIVDVGWLHVVTWRFQKWRDSCWNLDI